MPLRGAFGWVLFGIVWGAAILGIVLNSIDLEKFRKPSVVCYIAMGWVVYNRCQAYDRKGLSSVLVVYSYRRTFLHCGRYFLC